MTHLEKQSRTLGRHLTVLLAKLDVEAPAKAVHRLRTTSRRLQTLFNFCPMKLRGKERQALRELESIRKRAGKVRDLDVQLVLLKAIGNRSTASDRQSLQQALQAQRTRRAERLTLAARGALHSKFSNHLFEALEHAVDDCLRARDGQAPFAEAQSRLEELSREFAQEPRLKSRRLHENRIELKMIRYLAEFADASEAQQQFLSELKSVQDVLGQWRDWELLVRSAEKQFAERANCSLVAEVRTLLATRRALVIAALTRLLAPRATTTARKQPQAAGAISIAAQRA
jgi:CHAD domain-containing protein